MQKMEVWKMSAKMSTKKKKILYRKAGEAIHSVKK